MREPKLVNIIDMDAEMLFVFLDYLYTTKLDSALIFDLVMSLWVSASMKITHF